MDIHEKPENLLCEYRGYEILELDGGFLCRNTHDFTDRFVLSANNSGNFFTRPSLEVAKKRVDDHLRLSGD